MDLNNTGHTDVPLVALPLRDLGSFVHAPTVSDAEISDHRRQDQVYVGLHLPRHRGHRRGRHKHHSRKSSQPQLESSVTEATPPSQHVQFLLEEDDDEEHRTHDLFCELGELFTQDGEMQWKETARWIKFEEDVEEGGERWSKPHVATLSLHHLFELRSCIHSGTMVLDMDVEYFHQAVDILLDNMCAGNQLEETLKDQVRDVLLQRHRHLNEKHEKHHHSNGSRMHLPIIRSLADIGRKYSLPREIHHHDEESVPQPSGDEKQSLKGVKTMPNFNQLPRIESGQKLENTPNNHLGTGLRRNQSSGTDLHESPSTVKLNSHFMKKIPPGSDAANILVGEVDFLNHMIVGFIRLKNSSVMGDLTEVPVPTKFMFILLGPTGNQSRYHEIGRSIATLMTDEVFHDVAYHAHNREDLLAGIDEFLDQVTVLPPGEWDPSIRIEPPKSVPSQESRKTPAKQTQSGGQSQPEEEAEESHGDDPALQRTGRLFGGLIADIKRKKPFYLQDFKDALHVQTLASFLFLYFACLTPIITFGGLLADATKNDLGALESLLAGSIVGVTYALFSGQPLTILGSTGPVLVFEGILFNFCDQMGWYYLSFRWWVGMWTGLILILMVAFDLSALVRYITRFTEESFAALISIIFIKEAIFKLVHITDIAPYNEDPDKERCWCLPPPPSNTTANNSSILTNVTVVAGNTTSMKPFPLHTAEWEMIHPEYCEQHGGVLSNGCKHVADVFFVCCILFIGTFFIAYGLKMMRNLRFFPTQVRAIISDFAVIIAIAVMIGLDLYIGLPTPKLHVPDKFEPTNHETRDWFIPMFHEKNPKWLCVVAIIPALLATILFFMDQQITAVIVNRKENKLKKGYGYHLDLLLVAILIIVNSILGLPYFVAATVLSINHVVSLKKESTCTAPGERPKFLGVREQRVTGVCIFFMIGLSVLLTSVLKFIPLAILYGVFLYMGFSSLKGMQLVNRVLILFMPMKYQPDYIYLRHVRIRRVHFFTVIQVICLALLWTIKTIKDISIAFPLMVLGMCFIRKGLDWVFTQTELKWLDDIMPEISLREKDDKLLQKEQADKEQDECETLLDPKITHPGQDPGELNFKPKASIVNLAINGGNDSFVNQVNISEEVARCSIWKNLQSIERGGSDPSLASNNSLLSGNGNSKRKHKKRHKKDNGRDVKGLPTIPSSPTGKAPGRTGMGVAFYIDEEDSEKDEKDGLIGAPEIVIDPPSGNNSDDGSYRK
ncbi:sodium bicarbonate cotransporter 3-like isoform X3 [Mya arenaria]|uniref:sodium bicarbonate cotransporter 3-like isoform X3 n=1 Tax=Mya arenaria TaxID=6604 RepID=UPI0022DFCE10|nr:sodium bicarbonate cotransporter 3-like isoform X3 [Mya arenaria]